ncbi:hypothetical protein [Paracidovorax cattleyae]|uniref:Uncharacterized protein n=1 Tax=Paracidovorax cattleyae TaxID=80868 RepID=A0A1H0W5C4_9BURK|nr:hypothetical protein [Paracidovorax cattleyae]SDP85681.1 hypothetical protein SAMN04489708_13248 [Paracidovorax cattleyae]
MAQARKAVAIAAQVLAWSGYVLGTLLYALSGNPSAWVDGSDPQISSAGLQNSGNARLVGLCVLAALVLLQGMHALLSTRGGLRLCCLCCAGAEQQTQSEQRAVHRHGGRVRTHEVARGGDVGTAPRQHAAPRRQCAQRDSSPDGPGSHENNRPSRLFFDLAASCRARS